MKSGVLTEGSELPVLVEPSSGNQASFDALLAWVNEARSWIENRLLRHGALLLRGFSVQTPAEFERLCAALEPQLLDYAGGDSPRTAITAKVYTSTEYPAHLEIPLHNELSYRHHWPRKLFFFCLQPPDEGGETSLADSRRLLAAIDPVVKGRFIDKQVAYTQNLHAGWGLGKSWQDTFETDDRSAVENHCRATGTEFRWTEQGLWTRTVCPAVIRHPNSGEPVWFNQAHLWHVSSRGRKYQDDMLRAFGADALPSNACYGDGTPIDNNDLDAIRRACRKTEVMFPWRKGDVLLVDNVLAAHGRKPFKGERRILVAIGGPNTLL